MKKKPTPAPAIAHIPRNRDHRAYARTQAMLAMGILAHAVNATDNPATPYRYDNVSRIRFIAIAQLLVELVVEGEIIEPSEHDAGFQRFMNAVANPQISPEDKTK